MAQFQLYLLTYTINDSGKRIVLKTPISEFYNQEDVYLTNQNRFEDKIHSFCYSFDEKLSIHTNSQKELTFSMVKNIWLDNVWSVNPFTTILQAGSQILLIDKFNNNHIFTIKNIDYQLNKENITYNFSCQDSFTYQLIRQNDGYTIDNNADSEDFIGAKNIDWWVLKKIKPECHIGYDYIPLFKGLYKNQDGNICIFTDTQEIKQCEKILKQAYKESSHLEYFEKIPFSVSGSNASATLISLGEEIGMSLKTYEDVENNKNYFWFEPTKHEEVSGLKYSPYNNVQSFGFSHNGDSLTTILNVETNTFGEEIVALLPNIPLFFLELFQSPEWNEENKYYDGYFTAICQGKTFLSGEDFTVKGERIDKKVTLTIENFKIPYLYNKISLFKNGVPSSFYFGEEYITPLTHQITILINDQEYNDSYSLMPPSLYGTTVTIKLQFNSQFDGSTQDELAETNILLHFYRDFDEDELAFAEMADQIPWLENRLIDCSYFIKNNIISKQEFNILMDIFRNKLRVVNGKLLVYSNEYYEAVHQKTKILASLNETLDPIGAAFQADVLDPISSKGVVDDISYFDNAYNALKIKYSSSEQPTKILNYNEILTEYFNNYFNSRQRFLKNIYNFKKYFNEPVGIDTTSKIALIQLSLEGNPNYAFDNRVFEPITQDFDRVTEDGESLVTIYKEDQKTKATIVHKGNYKEFYYSQENKDELTCCKDGSGYISHQQYYRFVFKTPLQEDKKSLTEYADDSIDSTIIITPWRKDKEYVYYINKEKSDAALYNDNTAQLIGKEYNGDHATYTADIYKVGVNDIIAEYLFYKNASYKEGTNEQWHYYGGSFRNKASSLLGPEKIYTLMTCLTAEGLKNLKSNFSNEMIGALAGDNFTHETYKEELINYYIENFPLSSFTYTGPKHINKPFGNSSLQPINPDGTTLEDYINGYTSLNPINTTHDITIDLVTLNNELNYYKRCVADEGWGVAWGIIGGIVGGAAAALLTGGLGILAAGAAAAATATTIGGAITTIAVGGITAGVAGGTTSGIVGGSLITEAVWKLSDTKWSLNGKNTKDIENNVLDKIYSDYYAQEPRIRYTLKENSYETYKKLSNEKQITGVEVTINEETNKKELTINYAEKPSIPTDYLFNCIGLSYASLYNQTHDNDVFTDKAEISLSLNSEDYSFEDSELRLVSSSQYVNKILKYLMLDISNFNEEKLLNIFDADKKCSKIVNYPLFGYCQLLNVTEGFDDKDGTLTMNQLLDQTFGTDNWNQDENTLIYTARMNNITKKFLILEDCPYNKSPVFTKEDKNFVRSYNGWYIVDSKGREVNFLKENNLTKGFFTYPTKDNNIVTVEEWDDTKIHYYKKIETDSNEEPSYERVYTIKQIQNFTTEDRYYCFKIKEKWYQVLIDSSNQININDNIYLLSSTTGSTNKVERKLIENAKILIKPKKDNPEELMASITYLDEDGDTHEVENVKVEYSGTQDIMGKTNGEFWFLYKDAGMFVPLQEHAMRIELDLETYWGEAYAASKFCEYFLPEHWQPSFDGTSNFFFDSVISVIWEKDDEKEPQDETEPVALKFKTIKLRDDFLPSIQIYSENNQVKLPYYNFKRQTIFDQSIVEDELSLVEQSNFTSATTLSQNPSIKQAFDILGESLSNYSVEILDSNYKKTYYYVTSDTTGTKWPSIFSKIGSHGDSYSRFNGLHVMAYQILKDYYTDNNSFTQYFKAQKEQAQIWAELYKMFPEVLLEQNYKNEQATTNTDLYNMARLAFKDLSQPERNYNISVINSRKIEGYSGQELSIGDGIQIDVSEYYDGVDNVSQTMSQYLFITDLSYSLRKDSDISITVNSIKYQDKLIRRLVKLIK